MEARVLSIIPRPCITCGVLSTGSYCANHSRRPNLTRTMLEYVATRDRWTCMLCFRPVTHRGMTAGAASLDHVDRDVTNNSLRNLRLAHKGCNSKRR